MTDENAKDLERLYAQLGGYSPDGFMARLGIYGWEPVERALLSFMLGGGPMLMVQTLGECKTLCARAIGEMILNVPVAAYTASMMAFEDVIGFPNIANMKDDQEVDYMRTKTSIWGKPFLFLDEINRVSPAMQSKCLELVRSRTVMGIKTDVKWVMAAMNPIGYEGTQSLDKAYAGRFSIVFLVPQAVTLGVDKLAKVCRTRSADDEPAMSYWEDDAKKGDRPIILAPNPERQAEDRAMIPVLLRAAGIVNKELLSSSYKFIDEYVATVGKELASDRGPKLHVDGRRLGMLSCNLRHAIAIECAARGKTPEELFLSGEAAAIANMTLYYSFPIGADDTFVITKDQIDHVHTVAANLLHDRRSLVFRINQAKTDVDKLEVLFKEDDVDEATVEQLVRYICPPVEPINGVNRGALHGEENNFPKPVHAICYLLAMSGIKFPASVISYLVHAANTPRVFLLDNKKADKAAKDEVTKVGNLVDYTCMAMGITTKKQVATVTEGYKELVKYVNTWRR